MWEEIEELIKIMKQESAKSIAGAAIVIGLGFLLYQYGSDDTPEDPELAFDSQEFNRDTPKFNKDALEKLVINDLAKNPEFKDMIDKDKIEEANIALLNEEGTRTPASSLLEPSTKSSLDSDEKSRNPSSDDNKNSDPSSSSSDEESQPDQKTADDSCTGDDCTPTDEVATCEGDSCDEGDFCTLNPTDPSCAPNKPVIGGGQVDCETNPSHPSCPSGPQGPQQSFCELNPTHPTCITGPDAPQLDFCEQNPTDPTCIAPPACSPTMIVFPDKGPGTYSSNPTVSLYTPDSNDVRYCVTQMPGSCDPEPSLDGLPYSSGGFNVGASSGIFIVSFMANDDSCAKKYQYSYVIDNTFPDIEVTLGTQFLQTTERVNYTMNSTHGGDSNYYFWFLKVGSEAEFSSCNQLATDYDIPSFGMDFLGDTTPKDLATVTTPLSLDYYAGKKLAYGKDGNQFISFLEDQTSGDPATYKYGCQMNQVFVYDFPHFEFKSNSQAPINGNGEMEFSGSFQPYGPGRFPAAATDIILESGIDNIIN